MRVTVKLFGAVRESVGEKELQVELEEGATLGALRDLLAGRYPVVAELGDRLAGCVGFEVVPFETALREGDEVAFLPPVSGGGGSCWLSDEALDVGEAVKRVVGPGMGGIVTFVGTVRDQARGREIRQLEYEAYPEMAEREMQKVADEAARRWPGAAVSIGHRAGVLAVGEVAVVVAAAAPTGPRPSRPVASRSTR
jgi:molybdopterin synthase catalytic subunit